MLFVFVFCSSIIFIRIVLYILDRSKNQLFISMDTDCDHRVLKTINENKSSDQPAEKKKRHRKKCHGNRKVQRFRKKCRARGMKPHNIEKKIKKKFNDSRTNPPKSIIVRQY